MSRTKKLPIIKDRPRNYKKSTLYWRRVRRVWSTLMASGNYDLPNPKTIINDYDYSDYVLYSTKTFPKFKVSKKLRYGEDL